MIEKNNLAIVVLVITICILINLALNYRDVLQFLGIKSYTQQNQIDSLNPDINFKYKVYLDCDNYKNPYLSLSNHYGIELGTDLTTLWFHDIFEFQYTTCHAKMQRVN